MTLVDEELTVTQVSSDLWRLEKELEYMDVKVPKNFLTDFASVPWPASMVIPKSGKYNRAALVHDFLYAIQDRTRKEADDIFILAMRDLGVGWLKRVTMYRAVRTFGWLPWNRHEGGCINVDVDEEERC